MLRLARRPSGYGLGPFLLAAAVLSGCAGTDDPSADGSDGPTLDPSTSVSAAPDDLDSCLIGRWRQESMRSRSTVDDRPVMLSGWTGRVLEFRADGTEIVDYDQASPMTGAAPGGRYTETWRGRAVYAVHTDGDRLVFDSVDFGMTRVAWEYAGQQGSGKPGLADPVTYTCDEDIHTQKSDGYRASFTRL